VAIELTDREIAAIERLLTETCGELIEQDDVTRPGRKPDQWRADYVTTCILKPGHGGDRHRDMDWLLRDSDVPNRVIRQPRLFADENLACAGTSSRGRGVRVN